MSAPCNSLCQAWAVADDLLECEARCPDPAAAAEFLDVASEVLFHLSGRQWPGFCEMIIRPCSSCGCGINDCACGYRGGTRLRIGPPGPLVRVDEVLIDGAVLDPSAYRIDDFRYLVRVDGQPWPSGQDMNKAVTESDTFQVTYTYGQKPPAGGVHATALLACELAAACNSELDCRLPERVQSIVREGITMTILDPFDFLEKGRVGILEIDLWLRAVNPKGISERASIISFDVPGYVQTTG